MRERRLRVTCKGWSPINRVGNTFGTHRKTGRPIAPALPKSGSINNVSSYRPLIKTDDGPFWTPDGDSAGTNSEPASYLRLGPAGGVPGATSSELVSDQYDRYSIVSYTVDRPGNYSIADSRVELAGSSGDGVER